MRAFSICLLIIVLLLLFWWPGSEYEVASPAAPAKNPIAMPPEDLRPAVPVVSAPALESALEAEAGAGEVSPAPLSLEITPDLYTLGVDDDVADFSPAAARLPDFFQAGKKARPFTIKGRPTLDFENEDAKVPGLTGGTVEVEVKLK